MQTTSNPQTLVQVPQELASEHRHWEADLKLIVEGIASQIGEDFFRSCVHYLAELLQIRYALIAEFIDHEEPRAKVLAFWAGEDFGPDFDYVLAGTPCGIVLEQGLQIYPSGIQQKFPHDIDLVTMEAESYLGIAIYNSQGKVLGHIAGLHTQPLNRSCEEQEAILKIFAARSAAEIERQLAERELKQQNLRLEETLNQLKNTQAQLIQAEKMSSLGHLVAGIAHEINNPINFIHGNLSHARKYYGDLMKLIRLYQQEYPHPTPAIQQEIAALDLEFIQADLHQLLQSMGVGSQRISEIIKSLRNFSRLDESEYKVVDIHDGLEAALMMVKHRLFSDDQATRIDIIKAYAQLPQIYCSPGQLNQVFLHLLNNAIDALEIAKQARTPEEKSNQPNRIWVQTRLASEQEIMISIADNGVGIPDDIQSKVFDPFFSTKAVGKGTGLGLSVSYQIITDHGGKIEYFSTPQKRTEFVITLPISSDK